MTYKKYLQLKYFYIAHHYCSHYIPRRYSFTLLLIDGKEFYDCIVAVFKRVSMASGVFHTGCLNNIVNGILMKSGKKPVRFTAIDNTKCHAFSDKKYVSL